MTQEETILETEEILLKQLEQIRSQNEKNLDMLYKKLISYFGEKTNFEDTDIELKTLAK